ncbi:MAG TPA: DUF1800 domain-containing protein, partial [Flavisolibacter sp.]|nr:DUF1800 domain-containing protein [Flavisolibacter sp.]
MKSAFQKFTYGFVLVSLGAILSSFCFKYLDETTYRFPYQKAGLSQQEAAAHLLSRFSFGARPGDIEAVTKMGHEAWFNQQLMANLPDSKVEEAVAGYASLKMTNEEIVATYPRGGQALRMAVQKGVIDKDSANLDKKETQNNIKEFMQQQGLKPQAELLRELANQKILRAAYSNNQLKEVLTDFWFNHFNIAVSKGGVQQYLTSYERDVIRPNVLGKFETLLLATAKSPAMLTYLDNNKSTVSEEAANMNQKKLNKLRDGMRERAADRMQAQMTDTATMATRKPARPKMQGLNENYAREIMELHTMGVDGGYTQADVTQAARILTGWSLNPAIEYNLKPARQRNEKQLEKLGFVYDDNFFFAANKHDKGEKKVLGVTFPAGSGYEEGVKLIHLLATHPSTAKFIAKKLAVRFVSDTPPQALVDKMAKTFLEKDGDIKEVLITMVSAPEFWSKNALREKTKSPFEVAISAIRATDAAIAAPFQLYQWVSKMGQRLYNYQAPTGFPDRGQYWINTGSLLNRMNFGLAFASNRIPGVKVDLMALNGNREPESAEEALKLYSKILLPERNTAETVKRLT